MTGASFNPSGRMTKIPTALWDDLAGFSTMANERVQINGHGVRWQKPVKVIERIIRSTSNPGDFVLDFFSGVATVPVVCLELGRTCVATERDPIVHAAGAKRLQAAQAALEAKN